MSDDLAPEVNALAVNVAIPEHLQWTDERRGEEFRLTTLTLRLLPDGHVAVKAYGRPTAGGRGAYVSFAVRPTPEIRALVDATATAAARRWSEQRGLV